MASYQISIQDRKSMIFIPPNVSCHPLHLSMPPEPYYIRGRGGEVLTMDRTANRIYVDTLANRRKFGPITQLDDIGFETWKAGSIPPIKNEYVKLPSVPTIAVESFGDFRAEFPVGDTQLPKYVRELYFNGRNNDVGKILSENANHKQRTTRYFGTKIAEAIADESIKLGKDLEEIAYLGVDASLPEGAVYLITRAKDGKIMLLVAKGVYDKVARAAKNSGSDTEGLFETYLAEEHRHIIRKSFDMDLVTVADAIAEERDTKDDVYQKFEQLAEGAKGGNPRNPQYEKRRSRLKRQAEIKKEDRDTVGRYRELYSGNRGELMLMLYLDAVEKGHTGKEVDKYVARRMQEIENEVEGNSRMSQLERIADNEVNWEGQRQNSRENSPQQPETASAPAE